MTLRGADWTIVRHDRWEDCDTIRLAAIGATGAQTFLLPFDRPQRVTDARLLLVSLRAWRHRFARLLLDAHPYGGLQYCSSAIDLVPYQLEPALAMLRRGHPRLLLADDVGMGKTIEAGLVLAELAGRHEGLRALILVPAGLRRQWIEELSGRFHLVAVAADAAWLRSSSRVLPHEINPWSPPAVYVASFDFVKRPEALRPLEEVQWDLVIVDEAHAATIGTDRRAAIDAIASHAGRVLLLTATPPPDALQFAALCRIGAGGPPGARATPGGQETDEPDIGMFQRSRRGDSKPGRRSVLLSTRLTAEERRMQRLLERYTSLVWREGGSDGSGLSRLASTVLRKRALSSAGSLAQSLRRRQSLLATGHLPRELQLVLPLGEDGDDASGETVADELLGAPGLRDLAREQRWLNALLTAANAAAGSESKPRVLVRLLKRIRQPAIVFTEYRDTLEQLRAWLGAASIPVCVLHGGLSAVERRDALTTFARGRATLIATDTAAEGLNLQQACRVVVHFELPWNPSRMLQRAGRVDRLGQRQRVHEIAFVASDTAESLVLAPLARRARGRSGIAGDRMLRLLTESRVAEAIFEGHQPECAAENVPSTPCLRLDLTSEAQVEADRLIWQRGARATGGIPRSPTRHGIPAAVIRRSSLARGIVLIFELRTAEPNGHVVARSVSAVHAAMTLPAWPRRSRLIRQRLSLLLPGLMAAVSATVDRLGQHQLDAVRPGHSEAASRAQRRERALLNSSQSVARQLAQGGLFQRPAHRSAPRATDRPPGLVPDAEVGSRTTLTASAALRAVLVVSEP